MDDIYFNLAEERTRRVLCLDTQDLSLLPISYETWVKNHPGCLWSKPSPHERKDIFNFVIKSTDYDTFEESTHKTCYLCNTVVPVAYVAEHVNSSKHMAYQKIAEKGLERARKHKLITGIEAMKKSTEYFCEHCVLVIDISNKNEHEKSKAHKNSAALDTFLNNFALFYFNSNPPDITEFKLHKTDSDEDVALLKPYKKPEFEWSNERELVVMFKVRDGEAAPQPAALDSKEESPGELVNSETACKSVVTVESRVDKKEMNNNTVRSKRGKGLQNLDEYIRRIQQYGPVKLHKLNSNCKNRLKIETEDRYKISVTAANFDGIRRVGRHYECQICTAFVHKDARYTHREDEWHLTMVAQLIKDKHCIRVLPLLYGHCMLCNEVINDVVGHTQDSTHLRNVQKSVVYTPTDNDIKPSVSEKKIVETPGETGATYSDASKKANETATVSTPAGQYYCLPCDKHIHIKNTHGHFDGSKHKENAKLFMSHYMYKTSKGDLICKVCETKVFRYRLGMEEHVASPAHMENYNDCLAANEVTKKKDMFFCKPCGKTIVRMKLLSHIEKDYHKNKLGASKMCCCDKNDNIKTIEMKPDVDDALNTTMVNSTKTNEGPKAVDEGIAKPNNPSDSHDDKKTSRNQNDKDTLNVVKKVIHDTKVGDDAKAIKANDIALDECNSCDEEIPNNSSDIQVHNATIKHKSMDELLTTVNKILEDLLKHCNNPPEMHCHLQATDDENLLGCKVCFVKIAKEDADKHTNSIKHIRTHTKLMYDNALKLKKDKYMCQACSVYVEIGKELPHIETAEHEKRIASLAKGEHVLIFREEKIMMDKIQQYLKAIEHDNDIKPIAIANFLSASTIDVTNVSNHFTSIIDSNKYLICRLCQELVENSEYKYRAHTCDIAHDSRYISLLTYNQVFKVDNRFVCGYCEQIIYDELVHITDEGHMRMRKQLPKKDYCNTCQVSTKGSTLKDHVTSESHLKKTGSPIFTVCDVCNCTIEDKEEIESHNESFNHGNNLLLIDENKVVLKNKRCFCKVCDVTFSRDGFEEHMETVGHRMLLHNSHYEPTTDHCSDSQNDTLLI